MLNHRVASWRVLAFESKADVAPSDFQHKYYAHRAVENRVFSNHLKGMFKWIRHISISLCALAIVAYTAFPGWHRALTPTLFGMHKIAPNIYSDAPDKSKPHLALISAARTQASDFFGPLQTNPRYILCTTDRCTKRFGLRTRGLNLGYHLILIGPKGINASIITHEIAHSELHRTMGLRDMTKPKFPSWFDEGLASYISNDTRLSFVGDPHWIKSVRNFRQWSTLNSAET